MQCGRCDICLAMQSDGEEEYGPAATGFARHMRAQPIYDDVDSDSPEATSLNGVEPSGHDDASTKTAYYNAASEKSLSHQEAKLFYQRHQLEQSRQDIEGQSPVSRASTFSALVDADGRLSRTTSTTQRRDVRSFVGRDQGQRLPIPIYDPKSQMSDFEEADLRNTQLDSNLTTNCADVDDDNEQEVGRASNVGGAPLADSEISPELSFICANIRKVLDIRHKYIDLSLQGDEDNPKDDPEWKIYPPPPNPTWDDNKNRPISQTSGTNSLSNSKTLPEESNDLISSRLSSSSLPPVPPAIKRRKPGHDIGEDFDMADLLPLPGNDESLSFTLDPGSVYQVYPNPKAEMATTPVVKAPTLRDFYKDMDEVQAISSDGPTKSFAYRQLDIIEGKFHLYFLVNSYQETADSKKVPHRDFYNVRKVDTHVHHSACMNQKHLLRFIKSKMKKSPHEIVMFRDNQELTLQQVFESINLTAYDLSIDTLDMHVSRLPVLDYLPIQGLER